MCYDGVWLGGGGGMGGGGGVGLFWVEGSFGVCMGGVVW